jgi:hypothetical protein
MAAQIELGSKEKGVSQSPQESKFGPPSPGDSMAITPFNCNPAVPARGSKYRWASNLDKPTAQLNNQVCLAALAIAYSTTLQNQEVVVELEQASEGKKPPNQVPVVPINGARGAGCVCVCV